MTLAADAFTRELFAWQDQVVRDRELTPLAFHIAFVVAQHVNRDTGDAWPSKARIAETLRISLRAVRYALEQLEQRGHLHVKTGGGGPGDSNRYRPVLRSQNDDPASFPKRVNSRAPLEVENRVHDGAPLGPERVNSRAPLTAKRVQIGAQKGCTAVHPNHLNEPSEGYADLSINGTDGVDEQHHLHQAPTINTKSQGSTTEFETWWSLYPKKVEKVAARRAYDRVIAIKQATHAELMAGLMRYAAERTSEDPRFTKHPASWLNKGCWTDAPQPAGTRPGNFSALAYAAERITTDEHSQPDRPRRGVASALAGIEAFGRSEDD